MIVGYARVSSQEQNLDLQLDELNRAGCNAIYSDKASGATTKRTELTRALAALQAGDELVVWKIDRLGRNTLGLLTLIEELDQKQCSFRSLTDGISTNGPHGRFFLRVMAAFAEMERDLLRERTIAGLAAAKQRNRVGGRPRRMTSDKMAMAKKSLADGLPPKDVAEALGVSVSTLYRCLPARTRDFADISTKDAPQKPRRRVLD